VGLYYIHPERCQLFPGKTSALNAVKSINLSILFYWPLVVNL
jgi:hypothetical protein